jgi:outer membrane protein TolC
MKRMLLTCVILMLLPLQTQELQEKAFFTMNDAIHRALKMNNQLKAGEYAIQKAGWDKRYALALLFPTVTFNTRYTWIDDSSYALRDFTRYIPIPGLPKTVFQNSYYTSIDFSVQIFNGKMINGLSIASANKEMAIQQSNSTRRLIIFSVIRGYLEIMKNRELLSLQKEYETLSRLNYEKAERLHSAGRYSKAEALRWKVELQRQKSNVVTSESNLRSAKIIMHRLLNLAIDTPIEIGEQIPPAIKKEGNRIEESSNQEILSMIRLSDEELSERNAELAAAKSGETVSKLLYRDGYTNFMPTVSASYSYAWRENNTVRLDDYSPQTMMINFSMPLFTSFQNFSAVKSNYYAYRESKERFEDQLKNIRYLLTQTVNQIVNLKTQKELLKTNVEYTEHNYRVVEQQKEQGLVSNIDFLDAKLNLQRAKQEEINASYDFITSMVELYYMLGKLEEVLNLSF